MTKIYIYCLFDTRRANTFLGVYSSIQAVHRDALRLANRGDARVRMFFEDEVIEPTMSNLRNTLKGRQDVSVTYRTNRTHITVYKTKLKE